MKLWGVHDAPQFQAEGMIVVNRLGNGISPVICVYRCDSGGLPAEETIDMTMGTFRRGSIYEKTCYLVDGGFLGYLFVYGDSAGSRA